MKPFKPKTVAQQKKDYRRNVRRAWSLERGAIEAKYAEALEYSKIYFSKASEVAAKVGVIQDRVANAADREFGADKWRRDSKLLQIVHDRMMSRSAMCQQRARKLYEKSSKAREPYDRAMRRARARFEKLLNAVAA
jgi:hypothetical protein